MGQLSAYTVRNVLESGAGLRIVGEVCEGDTLAIEMANNSRILAVVKQISNGRLWLAINDIDIAFDAGSDESDLLPSSPMATTDWTHV